MGRSISRCASRHPLCSVACGTRIKRLSCRSRKNTWARGATFVFSRRCGKKFWILTWMENTYNGDTEARKTLGHRNSLLVLGSPDHPITRSVKDLVSGKTFHRPLGGFVGVANIGMDTNWLGHPLAMANLYAFGRLAWNPNLTASEIAAEWTELTFGRDPLVVKTVTGMLLSSWNTYESYTGPLGAGTFTDITGSHYGPGIESSERNGWGQWHRADHEGIGMDRSVATGTGFAGQYPEAVAKMYELRQNTPDELILFFHHVPYTYKLHSGKTVIQYIYDSHYEGVAQVEGFVQQWKSLHHHIDDARYAD